jgi:thiol:disulfide interchange protein DsbD
MNRPLRLLALCLLLPHFAAAQFAGGDDLVKPSLLADSSGIAPGRDLNVLIRLQIKEGWHVYWRFGGDSGAPPKVTWQLPAGFKAGDISWPIPKSYKDEGDLTTYVYFDEVLLPVTMSVPAQLASAEVTLKAELSWLVCEKLCVPGRGEVSLTLPVEANPQPANTELFNLAASRLPKAGPPPFQAAWTVKPDEFTVSVQGIVPDASVEFFPLPPGPGIHPGVAEISKPETAGPWRIRVPVKDGGATDTPWQGLIVVQLADGPPQGWMLAAGPDTAFTAAPPPSPAAATPHGPSAGAPLPALPSIGVLLWGAFLAGLILNLMPCVLPVISLKIFSFISQAGEEPGRVLRLGLAFVAGVFVFFLGIAAAAVALKSAGQSLQWGVQFQSPYAIVILAALVLVFALSMFGLFEITLGGGAENTMGELSRKEGYGGAFIHGLFTTLLGTSCTAPFLGPVLGFTQSPAMSPALVFGVFATIAAGMSLPYFLLTAQPRLLRFLPKPGAWMERFKQFMGFILLAVAIWLLSVLANKRDSSVVVTAVSYLLVIGLGAWIYGAWGRSLLAGVVGLVLALASWFAFVHGRLDQPAAKTESGPVVSTAGITWETFSPERVAAALDEKKPVFIDFTADWCINCKVNERVVLDTAPVASAFAKAGVLTLKADWTNGDPVITEWLRKFDRIGVPLYVLYRPGEPDPVLFPELLTQRIVLDELNKIPPKP